MKHLFSPAGEAALLATMAAQPLLAFDFDGTLAPIVARPDDARVPMPVAQRLQRLAERLTVVIITGRRLDDVEHRLLFKPAHIVGNHGAEDPADADAAVPGEAPGGPATRALDGLRGRLQQALPQLAAAGVTLEDKGASIALHYRLARDRALAQRSLQQLLQPLEPGLRRFSGKMVENIVAAAAHDKAQALARLQRRYGAAAAVFVGDDVNDEPVFARGEPSWLTVRVGRDDPGSQARFFLDSPIELPLMLDRMLQALAPGPG
ncbi:MAG: trehalose-phosphatase [Burkholderiaceae bacterium]